jgi:Na+-driven multidrug efflux pump
LRIICITCPAISITMMIISIFQATGQKTKPMILSFLRKGGIDVPFMFIMDTAMGANGIPWATPISDVCAMLAALMLFLPYWRQLNEKMKRQE